MIGSLHQRYITLFCTLICGFYGLVPKAYAWPPLFGPEWEFTNDYVFEDPDDTLEGGLTNPASERAVELRDKMVMEMRRRCPECKFKRIVNNYGFVDMKVTFPSMDNWYVVVSTDPACIELQTKPLTLAEFRKYGVKMQRFVFDAATAVGLKTDYESSAMHVHLGLEEVFGGDLHFYRNFVVDFMNHPELASGILAFDHANAPPLAALKPSQRAAFEKVLREVDSGVFETIEEFNEALNERVYVETVEDWGPPEKYQALNVAHDETAEVRAVDMPRDVPGVLTIFDLLQTRLIYLRGKKDLVVYNKDATTEFSEAELAKRFVAYLEEMKAPVEEFTKYFKVRVPKTRRNKTEIGREAEEFSSPAADRQQSEAAQRAELEKQKQAYKLLTQIVNSTRMPIKPSWFMRWFSGPAAKKHAMGASIENNLALLARHLSSNRVMSGRALDSLIRRLEKIAALKPASPSSKDQDRYVTQVAYTLTRLRELTKAEMPFYRAAGSPVERPAETQCSNLYNHFALQLLKQ